MAFDDAELQDIQGIGIAGFRKDHQELVFVRFGPQDASRRLLGEFVPRVANAWEVRLFNSLFSELRSRVGGDGPVTATWVGLGISASGYQKLGVDLQELGTDEGPSAFRSGMAARSQSQIGDGPQDQPPVWLQPFQAAGGVDAMLAVASDRREDLDREVDRLVSLVEAAGADVVCRERGATLPAPLTGHEHFGFKDGISQPVIDGFDDPPAAGEPAALPPGEFVLGYPSLTNLTPTIGHLWARGSYLVFRRLRQDVATFRAQASQMVASTSPALSADQIAAGLVGRWPSGAPLASSPGADPGGDNALNSFDYSDDPGGTNTPRFAHIRKVNPRSEARPDAVLDASQSHRMRRIGIPFGDPLPPGAPDDEAQRGLLFLAIVGDLARQFEFVQLNWLNNPNFPNGGAPATPGGQYTPPLQGTPPDGVDPLVGEHQAGDTVSLNQGPAGIHSLPLMAETIRVTAGEYFFCPAIGAIRLLADGATGSAPAPVAPPPTE